MKIKQLRIGNIYSYLNEKVSFDDYNIIVGPNASGKSNLLRVFELLGSDREKLREQGGLPHTLDNLQIERQIKHDPNNESFLVAEFELSKHELQILLQFLFKRQISDCSYDSLSTIYLILLWDRSPDPLIPPTMTVLRFANGFSIFKRRGGKDRFVFLKELPDNILDLITLPVPYHNIAEKAATKFRDRHGFDPNAMPHQDAFQDVFLKGKSIEGFFNIDDQIQTIEFENWYLNYHRESPVDYIVEIFRYCKVPSDWTSYQVSIWLILRTALLDNMSFLKDVRPGLDTLANEIFRLKNIEGYEEQYDDLTKSFSEFFDGVSFDVKVSPEPTEGPQKHLIKIREKNRIVSIDKSASAYYETLCLFSAIADDKKGMLVLDEPALNLHPTKIGHLSRLLMQLAKRQVLLITHSPYFIDTSVFTPGRGLIYIRKNQDSTSKVLNKPQGLKFSIRSYLFHPEIFFARCCIFVEGAGDALSLHAVSDAFDSLFQKKDVVIVDMIGKGNIDNYHDLIVGYDIPHIAMVDSDYSSRKTSDFIVLSGKLEDELKKLDSSVNIAGSIDPEKAYDIVFDSMQKRKDNVRTTSIGRVIDALFKKLQVKPENYWT